ncbi:MAG: hypothetical protein ACXVPQ_05410 [Bacteroidia bacterium]
MTEEVAIAYMHQQMRLLGKDAGQYIWEPVYVVPTTDEAHNGYFEVHAYNELYILYNEQNCYGVLILGENTFYNSDDLRQTSRPDFTGVIRFIKTGANWNFEILNPVGTPLKPIPAQFIRVVY